MENASKALIIAGAILIAILLIGVGVMVMRAASAPVEVGIDMSTAQAIEMFNSKFTGYIGVQKATQIKALMTTLNSTLISTSANVITVTFDPIDGANIVANNANQYAAIQSAVSNQQNYLVSMTYATGNTATTVAGYVTAITITEQP